MAAQEQVDNALSSWLEVFLRVEFEFALDPKDYIFFREAIAKSAEGTVQMDLVVHKFSIFLLLESLSFVRTVAVSQIDDRPGLVHVSYHAIQLTLIIFTFRFRLFLVHLTFFN